MIRFPHHRTVRSRGAAFHAAPLAVAATLLLAACGGGDTYVRIGRDAGRSSDAPTLPTGWEIVEIEVPDGDTALLPDGRLVIRTDNAHSFQGPVSGL